MPSPTRRPARLVPTAPTAVMRASRPEGRSSRGRSSNGALTYQSPGRHAQPDRCGPDRPEPDHALGVESAARSRLGDDAGVHPDLRPRPAGDGRPAARIDRHLHPRVRRPGQARPDRLPDRVSRHPDGRRRLVVRGVRDPDDCDRGARGSRSATIRVGARRRHRHGWAVHGGLDLVRRRRPPRPRLPARRRSAAARRRAGGTARPVDAVPDPAGDRHRLDRPHPRAGISAPPQPQSPLSRTFEVQQ